MATTGFLQVDSDDPAVYVLERVDSGREKPTFRLGKKFRYVDPKDPARRFVVPAELTTWTTDLASIPSLATWLVPKDGSHTPAALLHDAMISDAGEGKCYEGPDVTRATADDIFRDTMQEIGVPFLRRWMMWGAVSLGTLTKGHGIGRVFRTLFVLVYALGTGAVGILQVCDLVDLRPVRVPFVHREYTLGVEWMGDRAVEAELLRLLAAMVVFTAAAVVVWLVLLPARWKVGLVLTPALLLFGFPLFTAALAYLLYFLVESGLYFVLRGLADDDRGVNPPSWLKKKRVAA